MKKKYITPSVEVYHLNAASQLAITSITIDNGDGSTPVDPSENNGAGQDGRYDNPSNPNIWDNAW